MEKQSSMLTCAFSGAPFPHSQTRSRAFAVPIVVVSPNPNSLEIAQAFTHAVAPNMSSVKPPKLAPSATTASR